MSTEVYWGSGSTPAWRVLLAFAIKGVAYDSHLLSFSAGDTQKPEFLALNPRGKVPTVRDGDFTLNESLAILAWLDKKHPENPIFGETAEDTGRIWREIFEFENHTSHALNKLVRPIFAHSATPEIVAEALPEVTAELDRFAAKLGGRHFLVGDRLSAADIVWFCGVQYLVRAATRPQAAALNLGVYPLASRWPGLLAWANRIESIAGYEATFPPHWWEGSHPSPKSLS